MEHTEMRPERSAGALPALGSPHKSLAVRVWEILDDTHNVLAVVSRLRTEVGLGTGDSYAIERAVAATIEQFIAAGRVRLVRRGVGSEALPQSGRLLWSDG